MRKMPLVIGVLVVSLITFVEAQDKIEAPIWNVGDEWVFTQTLTMEVVGTDENTYTIKFSPGGVFIHDKSTLTRLYAVEDDKRKEYRGYRKRGLNFPLIIGKKWEDKFSSRPGGTGIGTPENYYLETNKVMGWEDIKVEAGKFRALKIEYKQQVIGTQREGKAWYWYVPEVKYFVKCEYEKVPFWLRFNDWELVSLDLKILK